MKKDNKSYCCAMDFTQYNSSGPGRTYSIPHKSNDYESKIKLDFFNLTSNINVKIQNIINLITNSPNINTSNILKKVNKVNKTVNQQLNKTINLNTKYCKSNQLSSACHTIESSNIDIQDILE